MLVFIDESYKSDSKGILHHVIGGIGVEEYRYRALVAGVHKVRTKMLVSRTGMRDADAFHLQSTKLPVKGEIELFEFKGEDLLQARRIKKYHETGTSPSILIAQELLSLAKKCKATTFGILSNPTNINEVVQSAGCPVQYQRLLDRVNKWMRDFYPDRMAIPVFDNIHGGINSHVSTEISRFLYRHAAGKSMDRIVPTPFWIDSKSTTGSQIADLVSHILMNSMMPHRERKNIEFLWKDVVALEASGREYRTITKIRK